VTLQALPVNAGITAALPRPHRDDTLVMDNRFMTTNQHIERGTVMTVQTAHLGHHTSTKTVAAAIAGAVLAVGAGYGVAALVLDEAPAIQAPTNEFYDPAFDRDLGFDPNGFAGTDREERALMHLLQE
jgi:hypothetical protein